MTKSHSTAQLLEGTKPKFTILFAVAATYLAILLPVFAIEVIA